MSVQRWPTMIHAGAGVCFHTGWLKAGLHDEGGPVCGGGERITDAWINGRRVPIAEAWPVLVRAYSRRSLADEAEGREPQTSKEQE